MSRRPDVMTTRDKWIWVGMHALILSIELAMLWIFLHAESVRQTIPGALEAAAPIIKVPRGTAVVFSTSSFIVIHITFFTSTRFVHRRPWLDRVLTYAFVVLIVGGFMVGLMYDKRVIRQVESAGYQDCSPYVSYSRGAPAIYGISDQACKAFGDARRMR